MPSALVAAQGASADGDTPYVSDEIPDESSTISTPGIFNSLRTIR